MNHSIYSADRTTHLKIVVVALVAGIVVAGFSISARMHANRTGIFRRSSELELQGQLNDAGA